VRAFADTTRHASDTGQGPSSLTFSPDGGLLYTNSDTTSISSWNPFTGTYLGNLPEGPRAGSTSGRTVTAIAVSRDGRTRVAVNSDGNVLRWRTNTSWYSTPVGSILGLAFHPDGKSVVAGESDGGIYAWDTATGEQTARAAEAGGIFAIEYTPGGARIVGTGDATFTATKSGGWLAKPRSVALEGRLFRGVMAVSPDGKWLAAAHFSANATSDGEDNRIHVWDTETLTEQAVLTLGEEWPAELTFSPDGSRLLAITGTGANGLLGNVGNPDGETAAGMLTWSVPEFGDEKRAKLGTDSLSTAVYTPDGRTVITAGTTGTIQLRDADTGQLREEFGRHPSTVRRLAISPDGRTLASVTTDDSNIRLWNLADHSLVATLTGHAAPINRIVFSPDGSELASGGTDTDVAVWPIDPEDAARQVCASLADVNPDDLDGVGC
jgi:WD40 repeat protein